MKTAAQNKKNGRFRVLGKRIAVRLDLNESREGRVSVGEGGGGVGGCSEIAAMNLENSTLKVSIGINYSCF